MKRILIALFCTATATQAVAAGGIDFSALPVGCSWRGEFSDRSPEVETFLGRVRGHYRTEARDAASGRRINAVDYDDQGLMIRRTWADGRWETFEPHSCFAVPGSCSFTYRNGKGDNLVIDSTVARSGKSFTSRAKPRGGAAYPTETFRLGPFGLVIHSQSSNYSTRITKLTGCGAPAS